MKIIVLLVANSILLYFMAGFVYGIYFLFLGAPKIDPLLKNSKWAVRILLIPGIVATWPFFLRKMMIIKETGATNKQLRKIHRNVWTVIAIVVPIIIIPGISDVDFRHDTFSQIQSQQHPIPAEKLIANTDQLSVQLLQADNKLIMVLNLKTPFKTPSPSLYTLQNGTIGKFLGQLTNSGKYRFDLSSEPKGIMCYDEIKDEIITKIEF